MAKLAAADLTSVDGIRIPKGPIGPAGRRRDRQRQRIIEEAVRLFEENGGEEGGGHDKTTVDDIAARSDISVRTFFRYFDSKTDAIYVDLPGTLQETLETTEYYLKSNPPAVASLKAAAHCLTILVSDPFDRERVLRAMRSQIYQTRRGCVLGQTKATLAKLLAPHLPEKDRELRSVLLSTMTMMIRELALELWVHRDGQPAPLDCFNEALSLLRGGLNAEFPERLVLPPSVALGPKHLSLIAERRRDNPDRAPS